MFKTTTMASNLYEEVSITDNQASLPQSEKYFSIKLPGKCFILAFVLANGPNSLSYAFFFSLGAKKPSNPPPPAEEH